MTDYFSACLTTTLYTALLLKAILSVCPSVRYTREQRLNGSRYRNTFHITYDRAMFLVSWDQIRSIYFRDSPRMSTLKESENLTYNPNNEYSRRCNVTRWDVTSVIHWSCIQTFDWYRNRWPRMTLNGVIAVILRGTVTRLCSLGHCSLTNVWHNGKLVTCITIVAVAITYSAYNNNLSLSLKIKMCLESALSDIISVLQLSCIIAKCAALFCAVDQESSF